MPLQPKMPQVGAHASIQMGYQNAIKAVLAIGGDAIQVFVGNNKGYAAKKIPKKDAEPIREYIQATGMFFIIHSPYILNFARPLELESKPIQRYIRDLENAKALGAVGCVLHMGSNVKQLNATKEECYRTFVRNLQTIIDNKPPEILIILENMAGGGTQMCCHMKEWANFWNNFVPKSMHPHIKWCVDTAHMFAAGEYNISSRREAMRFYQDFDSKIGWEHVLCFHFNGSKSEFKSCHDNHGDIGENWCGKIKTAGMRQLARIAGATEKPLILEVPGETPVDEQIEIIRSWFE